MPKHYFLGGNTPYGFYSYYNHLIEQKSANRVYCIKGGAGTGKSSFMKKVAKAMEDNGFTVEYAHCSSDPASLDAIVINEKNIAFVDGTSPHIVDPKTPGAVDEILNFGAFWDKDGIIPHKDEIISLNGEISYLFSHAYSYLASAKCIWDDTNAMYEKLISKNIYPKIADKIVNTHFNSLDISDNAGKARNLFATAFTPEGVIDTSDTIAQGFKVYTLKGYIGSFLNILSGLAQSRGLYTENYYNPMSPGTVIEHLVIPELETAFISSNEFHTINDGEIIDFTEHYQNDMRDIFADEIRYNKHLTFSLIEKATSTISKAKALHDQLEKCYIPHMDFKMVDKEYERVMSII